MRLLNHDFEIIVEENTWNPNVLGTADLLNSRILLSDQVSKSLRDATLIHEVIHLIGDIQGVDLTEEQTKQMEVGFYGFIMDNPDIITDMMGVSDE